MDKPEKPSGSAADKLRQLAEERLRGKSSTSTGSRGEAESPTEHELGVHRIELEIQNEQLRATQLELEAARDRYADLYDFAPVGYLTVDQQGVIETANLTVANLLGVERGRLVGQPLGRFVHREDQDRYYFFRNRLFEADGTLSCEIRIARSGGDYFDARLDAILWSSGGALPTCRVVITDITERKRDEDAIRQARDAAEGASRAKSHFLAKMSHEIRTPLNGVLGAAHVLLGTLLNDEQRRHAQTIIDSGEALLWVLNDILDLSKIEAGKLNLVAVPFDLHRQVEVVVQTFATQAQMRRLELITRIGPEVPQHVAGDPLRLRQVLSNLLGNAIKFTPAGGVHVLLESTRRGERDALVRFAVIDTGIGVAHEAQSRIFEPFVQAEDTITRQYGGTGLGLAIAKQLVEMMGGEIGMASEPGRGATFWFTLPLVLVEPSQTADAGASLSAAAIEPIRAKVLLVEDNPINVEVMKAMLEQLGCSVATAHNGREALRQLAEHTFDVVLMDCEMPVMDGYAATAAIRERERESGGHQPIIALTAHVLEGDREACVARGMDDFLAKPFRPEELRAMIRKHLSGTPPQPGLPAMTPSPTRLSEDEQSKIVFEPRAFDHIVQAGGDEGRAVLARVLDLFRHQMPERVAALHRAAETADLATAAFIAHSAGSSAQLLGGGKLTALCRAIEAAARAQELASVWALAARLPAELQALLAALDAQAPPPIAPVSAAPTARAYRSVLVVDDAEDHRLLAAHALRKVGFEVHLAKDGEDALQIAGRIRPDLVLMDARLPGIDGYTACERLLALPECRGARVVMVTGAVFPDSVERARAVGAIAVLPKMWDWGEFVQAIEALVEPSVKAVH